jgi:hypothetical protein
MDLAVKFNQSMCVDSHRQTLSQSSSSGTRIMRQFTMSGIGADLVLVLFMSALNMLLG